MPYSWMTRKISLKKIRNLFTKSSIIQIAIQWHTAILYFMTLIFFYHVVLLKILLQVIISEMMTVQYQNLFTWIRNNFFRPVYRADHCKPEPVHLSCWHVNCQLYTGQLYSGVRSPMHCASGHFDRSESLRQELRVLFRLLRHTGYRLCECDADCGEHLWSTQEAHEWVIEIVNKIIRTLDV